jgi:hypothetical protein
VGLVFQGAMDGPAGSHIGSRNARRRPKNLLELREICSEASVSEQIPLKMANTADLSLRVLQDLRANRVLEQVYYLSGRGDPTPPPK